MVALFHYFTTLRKILDKCTRAQIQNAFVTECIQKHIIPKGFKLSKAIFAVDPSPKLMLAHYKITTQAETLLMQAVVEHYTTAIPKLIQEFTEYYDEIVGQISAPDKRLLILKLIHYKNEVVEEKRQIQAQKMDRPTNKHLGNDAGTAQYNQQDNYDAQRPQANHGLPSNRNYFGQGRYKRNDGGYGGQGRY